MDLNLVCPSCGDDVIVTPEAEEVTCPECGQQYIVNREDDEVTLI